jgi:hypothetical protein
MGRSSRTVRLVKAFRTILRAEYPERPGLADEIESYDWLLFDPNRRSVDPEIWAYVGGEEFWRGEERAGEGREDEVKAFNDAHRRLEEFVRQEHGKFRLRGVLDPRKPLDDIDPADAKVGEIDVFAEELRVFLNGKVARTYRQVHCDETDLDRCVAMLRSGRPLSKLKGEDIAKFVKDYFDTEPKPTLTGKTGIRNKWSDAGHGAQARDLLDDEYRNQAIVRNISLKRGPKRILQK